MRWCLVRGSCNAVVSQTLILSREAGFKVAQDCRVLLGIWEVSPAVLDERWCKSGDERGGVTVEGRDALERTQKKGVEVYVEV